MGYNKGRVTISNRGNAICTVCFQIIHKGDSIYIEPKKLVIHAKCHKQNAKS